MTKGENLNICVMEGCGELIQAVSKVTRFGKDNHHPDAIQKTNEEDLIRKYYQLQAVVEMVFEKEGLRRISEQEIDHIKKVKKRSVNHYSNYSKDLGIVVDPD